MSGTKRQDQKALTRQKIIDTALLIYAREGFSTPTANITKEAGISHGAVFAHFPTREALLLSVLDDFTQTVCGKLHELTLGQVDVTELLYAYIEVLEEYEAFYIRIVTEMSSLPDETASLILQTQSVISHHFGVIIERGKQLGLIKDIPRHMLFNCWVGLLHYYLQNWALFAPGESVLKRYKNELFGNFVTLISR